MSFPPYRLLRLSAMLGTLVLINACRTPADVTSDAMACFQQNRENFSEVLGCYKKAHALIPLNYKAEGVEQVGDVQIRRYRLISQDWGRNGAIAPAVWNHRVEIYVAQDVSRDKPAILVVNDGVNHPLPGSAPGAPNNFTRDSLLRIARETRSSVVVVDDAPNQYLTYNNDGKPRTEDDSVAHSWKLFMQAPAADPFMALNVPVMEAIIKTMDLADRELPVKTSGYILTGASKRAWAVWLATLVDTRVTAIAPVVIETLSGKLAFEHAYQVYGHSWPLAFIDYYREGVTAQLNTEGFDKLMQVIDPLRYLDTAYAHRLRTPKYIVNASGDDFFTPDSSRNYYDSLPGQKTLRSLPNSAHDIRAYLPDTLIPFFKRIREGRPLPSVNPVAGGGFKLSEVPSRVVRWDAHNPAARDFRFNCNIRYVPTQLPASQTVAPTGTAPKAGWHASFVEATFEDGMIATSQVQITPDTYPSQPPAPGGPFCQTLQERVPSE
ncbi:PhoPQ-activated protein PqaA family protein [Pseudomonas poae]|nr:PhoPQ-activated protein PqaA family protein [Pseudomonas poae]